MPQHVTISNRQNVRPVNLALVRKIIKTLLRDSLSLQDYQLTIVLLAASEITRLNETYLGHAGSTDVLTFDYSETPIQPATQRHRVKNAQPPFPKQIHGEIYVCIEEALIQSRRFRTSWESECVRYIIHGVLHLLGHDDQKPSAKRQMKRVENRMLKQLARQFDLRKLDKANVR